MRLRTLTLALALFGAGCFHIETNGYQALEPDDPDSQEPTAETANVILNGVLAIYNQHLAGRKTGLYIGERACPNGGSVHISGTTSYDRLQALTRVELTYTFSRCSISQADPPAQLTIERGSLHEIGTFDSSSFVGESLNGALDFSGEVRGVPASGAACTLSVSRNSTRSFVAVYRSVSGTLCGISFAYRPHTVPPPPDAGSADAGIADAEIFDGGGDP